MSKSLDLLSARNLILAAAAVLILSVLGMYISMLRPRDSGGLARDSFGTRGAGYRAIVEVLEELGIEVSRSVAPPQPSAGSRQTIALLDPNSRLVAVGPKYLHTLRTWVEGGGRVVVTPSVSRSFSMWNRAADDDDASRVDVLEALGVEDVVTAGDMSKSFVEEDYTAENDRGEGSDGASRDDAALNEEMDWDGIWTQSEPPPETTEVTVSGSLQPLASHVRELSVPSTGVRTLRADAKDLDGSVTLLANDNEDEPLLLVAVMRRGAGEIVVLSDPAIVSNRLLAQADNSVLAVNLLSPESQAVMFDEFYHGLSVRGNPLYLLTRPGFAAVTVGLLLLVGALAWRAAAYLGPPLNETVRRRRDIGEYVSAMAEFFSHGRESRRFIVREVRDGVLRQLCRELRLPTDTAEIDTITSALARRDRARAERLAAAVGEVDRELAAASDYPRTSFLPAMQRLANCL